MLLTVTHQQRAVVVPIAVPTDCVAEVAHRAAYLLSAEGGPWSLRRAMYDLPVHMGIGELLGEGAEVELVPVAVA